MTQVDGISLVELLFHFVVVTSIQHFSVDAWSAVLLLMVVCADL